MAEYINTEQMERAACTFDNAVDHLQRVANQFEQVAYSISQAVERLEQLAIVMQELEKKNES